MQSIRLLSNKRHSYKTNITPAQKPKHKEHENNSFKCLDLFFRYSLGLENI